MTQPHFGSPETNRYLKQAFSTAPQELRINLEVGNEAQVMMSLATLAEQFSAATGLSKADCYSVLGVSQATVSRSRSSGSAASLDAVDRAFQSIELFARVAAMLGEERARHWLGQPNHHLGGHAPYQLLRTSTGRQRLGYYLESLEDGTYG